MESGGLCLPSNNGLYISSVQLEERSGGDTVRDLGAIWDLYSAREENTVVQPPVLSA